MRCGEIENKIGQSEKKYQNKINSEVIVPLRSFLEVDIKNVLVSDFANMLIYYSVIHNYRGNIVCCMVRGLILIHVKTMLKKPSKRLNCSRYITSATAPNMRNRCLFLHI